MVSRPSRAAEQLTAAATGVAIDTADAYGDRVLVTISTGLSAVLTAAGLTDVDVHALSPVAYKWGDSDDETVAVLPLPAAGKVAARIAERHRDESSTQSSESTSDCVARVA